MKIPRWAQVLIGVGIVAVFLGIGAIIAITAWVSQNLNVSDSTARQAEEELEKVRKQFKARPPLLELKDGVPRYDERRLGTPPSQPPTLQNLHVIAWDPEDEKLSRITIPWWIVRMKSGPFRFGSYASGLDDEGVRMTTADIEKYGPGVILDTSGRRGEHVLIWAQ